MYIFTDRMFSHFLAMCPKRRVVWSNGSQAGKKRERVFEGADYIGDNIAWPAPNARFIFARDQFKMHVRSCKCREEKNVVFWFGAQFISTLNFNQSGWLILFNPDLHLRPPNLVSCQTHSLWLENADQCRRHTGRSSIAMLFSWTMPPSADILLRL